VEAGPFGQALWPRPLARPFWPCSRNAHVKPSRPRFRGVPENPFPAPVCDNRLMRFRTLFAARRSVFRSRLSPPDRLSWEQVPSIFVRSAIETEKQPDKLVATNSRSHEADRKKLPAIRPSVRKLQKGGRRRANQRTALRKLSLKEIWRYPLLTESLRAHPPPPAARRSTRTSAALYEDQQPSNPQRRSASTP